MNTSMPTAPKFNKYYQKHLKCLKLNGLQPKTVEAYSRAIRRIGNYFVTVQLHPIFARSGLLTETGSSLAGLLGRIWGTSERLQAGCIFTLVALVNGYTISTAGLTTFPLIS